MDNQKYEWDKSYQNLDNFVFYPHEEVIRFVSKFIRKKIGLHEYKEITSKTGDIKILDLGCGIGRHIIYCHEMGLSAYGIDLSKIAIQTAINWAKIKGINTENIVQGDTCCLPWEDSYFDYAISHGVLDSMSFDTARLTCLELAKKMKTGGLFYCDLISGDDSYHSREFCGEEKVETEHENGTIQSYFNFQKIKNLINDIFEIVECFAVKREDVIKGKYISRYHLILKKI